MKKVLSELGSSVTRYWVGITATFLGGLAGIWWLSERTQDRVDLLIVKSSGGISLNGDYRINSWVLFLNLLVIFSIATVCIALTRELLRARPENRELERLKNSYNDILNCARRVTSTNLYPGTDGRPRINIDKMLVRHIVEKDGSTEVVRIYEISCPNEPAHAFEIWIQADDESDPLLGHRGLEFLVLDLGKNKREEISWMPTSDSLRRKAFAIYFREMKKGDSKNIEIRFRWPGFLRRVLEKGSAEFWWSHKAATENATSDVTYEWLYKPGFPQVSMGLLGAHSPTAQLRPEQRPEGICWIYTDPCTAVDKRDYRVSIQATGDFGR